MRNDEEPAFSRQQRYLLQAGSSSLALLGMTLVNGER